MLDRAREVGKNNFIWLLLKLENNFLRVTLSLPRVLRFLNRLFTYHLSVYLRAGKAESCDLITLPCCRRSHSRPGFPVAVPLVRSGLPTSGSDEPNWKHVLHAGSPDRWDNIILLMTERERRREGERDVGNENPPSSKGLLVLNSSTLSCRRFWGSYYRKAARLCLHMEYPLNLTQYSAGLARCQSSWSRWTLDPHEHWWEGVWYVRGDPVCILQGLFFSLV